MREWLHLLGRSPKNNGEPKWFERDDGNARLAHDRRLLTGKYPDLEFALNFRLQKAVLRGTITLKEETSGIPTRIKNRIIFPDDYPETEPTASDDANQFPHVADRHFYKGGECCLWLPLESQWRSEEDDTLLNFVDQVAVFFERQLMYDASGGVWAWGERGHGDAGYIEFLEEQLDANYQTIQKLMPVITGITVIYNKSKCPCGSNRDYSFCHKQKIDYIKDKISRFLKRK
jgi:hypothetical protein